MDIIPQEIIDYAEGLSSPETSDIKELNRETNARVLLPRLLSGQLQGRILSMISSILKPSCFLEIGTYTGYSAICLAGGLADGGMLHTIDINDELKPMVKKYLAEAGCANSVK